jgi:hypothetical protein
MSDTSNKRVNIFIDQTAAEVALIKLQSQADVLTKKIAAGQQAGVNMVKELKKLDEVKVKMQDVTNQLDKGLAPSLTQQRNLVKQLNNELQNFSKSDPAFKEKAKILQEQNTALQKQQAEYNKLTGTLNEQHGTFGKIITRVTEYFAAFSIIKTVQSAVSSFFKNSIKESEDAEKAASRLRNILESIGRIDAFDRLAGKAADLAKEFKFKDNDDLIEAEQQLITYGKLTENQINKLLPLIINFSAKQGIGISESSSVIIKALEGNSKALKEYGINLKEGNSATERFNILMTDLKPRVEGAAKAFGETLAGSAATAKQELADVEEQVGNELTPALTGFYKVIAQTIDGFVHIFGDIKEVVSQTVDAVVKGAILLKDFATLDFAGAAQKKAQWAAEKQAAQDRIQEENDIADAKKHAASIADDYAKKTSDFYDALIAKHVSLKEATKQTKEEQERLLASQVALQTASLNSVTELAAAGDTSSKKFKDAVKRAREDSIIVASITEAFAAQNNTSILGVGSGNDVDPEAAKKAQEAIDAFKKIVDQAAKDIRNSGLSSETLSILKAFDDYNAKVKELSDLADKGHISVTDLNKAIAQQGDVLNASLKDIHKNDPVGGIVNLLPSTIDVQDFPKKFAELIESLPKVAAAIPINFEIPADTAPDLKASLEKTLRDINAGNQLDLLNANAKEKKDILLKNLKDEETETLNNTNLTENERLLIEKEFADKRKKVQDDYVQHVLAIVNQALQFAADIVNVLSKFEQARSAKENAAFEKEKKNSDQRKKMLQDDLNAGIISKSEFAKRSQAIDKEIAAKEDALKKEQAKRQQKIAIAQAFINGGLAVTQAFATLPIWAAVIAAAVATADVLAQIAIIKAQQFAGGGKVDHAGNGKINRQSNIPTQSNGDDVLATVKRGEVVLNKSQQNALGGDETFKRIGVPGFATGGAIKPAYSTRTYSAVNFPKINKSYEVLRFADGGLVQSTGNAVTINDSINHQMMDQLNANTEALNRNAEANSMLLERLRNPIDANLSLNKFDEAKAMQDRINKKSQFR